MHLRVLQFGLQQPGPDGVEGAGEVEEHDVDSVGSIWGGVGFLQQVDDWWGVLELVSSWPSWCERSVQLACSHPVPQDVLFWALEWGRMFSRAVALWRWRLRLKRCWRTPQSELAQPFSMWGLILSGPAAFLCLSLSISLLTWLAVMSSLRGEAGTVVGDSRGGEGWGWGRW